MEIKIEVSDEKFSEFFGNDITQYITEDIKKEIIQNAIKDFCSTEEFKTKLKGIFIDTGNYRNNYKPTLTEYGQKLFEEAIKDDHELLDPAKKTLEDIFSYNAEKILVTALSKMILDSFLNSTDFINRVQEVSSWTAHSEIYKYVEENSRR